MIKQLILIILKRLLNNFLNQRLNIKAIYRESLQFLSTFLYTLLKLLSRNL